MREYVKKSVTLDWKPVIQISITGEDRAQQWNCKQASVSVSYERFYITKKPDGSWVRVRWDTPVQHRLINAHELRAWHYQNPVRGKVTEHTMLDFDVLPVMQRDRANFATGEYDTTHYLDYDESMWAGIELLAAQLVSLGEKLGELVSNDQGRQRIADRALKLLPEETAKETV